MSTNTSSPSPIRPGARRAAHDLRRQGERGPRPETAEALPKRSPRRFRAGQGLANRLGIAHDGVGAKVFHIVGLGLGRRQARQGLERQRRAAAGAALIKHCLLYTSDAADERSSVDLGGRRIL